MLAGLTTNVELLTLALDVLVEAEQLAPPTAGSISTTPASLWTYFFLPFINF
jgi:hypothetical protein